MDYLDQFEIPVQSIQNGMHDYHFEVDKAFFDCFEESPFEVGNYTSAISLDKRENEFILDFDIKGYFEGPCDRCLADINVSSSIRKTIWVKFSDEKAGQDHDDDVIYIPNSDHAFNVGNLIYELIILSIPMVRRYDCKNDPEPKCDFKVLSFMEQEEESGTGNNLAEKFKNIREN